jgi:hypothetical protein
MLGQEERLCYESKSYFTDVGFAIVEPYVAKTWPANLGTTGMGSACEFAWEYIRAGQFGPHYGIGASNEKCFLHIVLLDFARCEQVLFSIFRKE